MYNITFSQLNGHNVGSEFTDLDQSAHMYTSVNTLTKYIENHNCYCQWIKAVSVCLY